MGQVKVYLLVEQTEIFSTLDCSKVTVEARDSKARFIFDCGLELELPMDLAEQLKHALESALLQLYYKRRPKQTL